MILTDTSTVSADVAGPVIAVIVGLVAFAAVYVWLALALSAVFRKAGQQGWQAWVPILNTIVFLRIAGFPAWYVLALLVPVLGPVVMIIAAYRVNRGFGFGVGMTVLAALVSPVWVSILGFGSARWMGVAPIAPEAGARRATAVAPASGYPGAPTPAVPPAPRDYAPPAPFGVAPPPGYADAHAAAYVPAAAEASAPPAAASLFPDWAPPVSAPAEPEPAAAPAAAQPVSWAPPVAPDYAPPAPVVAAAPAEPAPAADPELVTGVPGAPAPASPAPQPDWSEPAAAASTRPDWGGFDLGAVSELTGEVTGAISGAPEPVAAFPGVAGPIAVVSPGETGDDRLPPVTRVPAAAPQPAVDEPWAPARSPLSDPEAFPEASGPISAIVGAPDAGAPRAARSSVSAQHAQPELPDDDELEHTVIARRRRTQWSIVPPGGAPVPLSAEVVILGRRPARDAAYPAAQLVAIDDGTVSKTHARLVLRDDVWWVTDLGSTNGVLFATFMGTEVEATPGVEVQAGDRFLLGDAEVRLVRSDA